MAKLIIKFYLNSKDINDPIWIHRIEFHSDNHNLGTDQLN